MEKDFLWQEKLELFIDVFCSEKTINELKEWIRLGKKAEYFNPSKLFESALSAPDLDNLEATGNAYYHLNGRNLLGIKRKWMDGDTKIRHGITLNSGEITIDHSALTERFLSKIFLEAHNKEELIDTVKELLNLSNEEIVRKFNITGSKSDMANLFNAIALDPIIDYEIERGNFKRYGRCWADSHMIRIATKNGENYEISSITALDFAVAKPMEMIFPNGECITFKQSFIEGKGDYDYTLDDISTEILEIKGDSELLKKVVAQIERFSQRELDKKENTGDERENTADTKREKDLNALMAKKAALEAELAELNEQIRLQGEAQQI